MNRGPTRKRPVPSQEDRVQLFPVIAPDANSLGDPIELSDSTSIA